VERSLNLQLNAYTSCHTYKHVAANAAYGEVKT